MKRIQFVWFVLLLCGLTFQTSAASSFLKTIRFEHGHPIILRSGDAFLVLEFETHPHADVHWDSGSEFQVRAPYRYLVFEGSGQVPPSIQTGEMMEYFSYQDVIKEDGKSTRQLKNIGSIEHLKAGSFSMHWSNGGSGKASWLYLRNDPPIELILQLKDIPFEEIDRHFLESLDSTVNVFSVKRSNGVSYALNGFQTRHKDGEEMPRIIGITQRGSDVVLELDGLIPGKRYFFERSSSLGTGKWSMAGSFVADSKSQLRSPSHDGNVSLEFFRISNHREGFTFNQ